MYTMFTAPQAVQRYRAWVEQMPDLTPVFKLAEMQGTLPDAYTANRAVLGWLQWMGIHEISHPTSPPAVMLEGPVADFHTALLQHSLLLYQRLCYETVGEQLFTFPVVTDAERHFLHQEGATAQTIHRLEAAYGDDLVPALCDWRDEGGHVCSFSVMSNAIHRLSDPTNIELVWKTVAGRK